ncbi:hypothetical protein V2G26_016633 [Clonostachys chloroleuca]
MRPPRSTTYSWDQAGLEAVWGLQIQIISDPRNVPKDTLHPLLNRWKVPFLNSALKLISREMIRILTYLLPAEMCQVDSANNIQAA